MQQQKGALPARSAVELTLQVAKALEAAHRQGIIHRDIKPENVLITEAGEAKVADFGIARAVAASTRLTRAGLLMGTLHYISPEQAYGNPASFQSDLYSLGVVLYQMLTAEFPFDADTPAGIMMKHISGQLRPPKGLNSKIPKRLNEVCLRLLARDPYDRYPSASVLVDELEELRRSLEDEERLAVQPTFIEEAQPIVIGREDEKQEAYSAETIPGESEATSTVEVPDVRGQTATQAGNTVANRGLKLGDQEEITSEEVAEGEIVGQNPGPGTRVEVGSSVSVAVSLGPSLVEVPDLAGQNLPQARRALASAGLSLGSQKKASNDEVPDGAVIRQDPAAGTKVKRGSSISVTVSSGPEKVSVPDLAGQRLPEARSELAKADLKLGGKNEAPSDRMTKDKIIKQNPAAGTKVKRGGSVSVTVSSGSQEKVTVPDVPRTPPTESASDHQLQPEQGKSPPPRTTSPRSSPRRDQESLLVKVVELGIFVLAVAGLVLFLYLFSG